VTKLEPILFFCSCKQSLTFRPLVYFFQADLSYQCTHTKRCSEEMYIHTFIHTYIHTLPVLW
jgi:hypothetical protein